MPKESHSSVAKFTVLPPKPNRSEWLLIAVLRGADERPPHHVGQDSENTEGSWFQI